MNDVKKAAADRAAHPSSTPAGSSFESDRKREKAALTMQLDALDSSQIRKIAAVSETDGTPRKLRVASYCRVSTDDIDQAISIHLQQAEYGKQGVWQNHRYDDQRCTCRNARYETGTNCGA